jgi:hypothetical protein
VQAIYRLAKERGGARLAGSHITDLIQIAERCLVSQDEAPLDELEELANELMVDIELEV